jgi:hypothetical protein
MLLGSPRIEVLLPYVNEVLNQTCTLLENPLASAEMERLSLRYVRVIRQVGQETFAAIEARDGSNFLPRPCWNDETKPCVPVTIRNEDQPSAPV